MKITVYRQDAKVRPGGVTVYKGEDAIPYADNGLLLVADGMGGSAGMRHTKFRAELFDSDKLPHILFDGVLENISEETLAYIKRSFFEFHAVKDCYFDNIFNIKKSGYFGSRILSSIVLHEVSANRQFYTDQVFDALSALTDAKQRDAYLNTLSEKFSSLLLSKMRKAAANANLIYESAVSGMSLLGTTLCLTLYREKDDCVEAIYLLAGDSRPYMWNEEGLYQIVRDQEREDGCMTSYVYVNDGATLQLKSRYMRFKKPCVLFNCSDGCFDSSYFAMSQMAYEKLLLDTLQAADTAADAEKALHDFFLTGGRHDDSSTIALRAFGYEGFDALKESAARRAAQLALSYLSRLPDLLTCDHRRSYDAAKGAFDKKLSMLKDRFAVEPCVRTYLEQLVQSEPELGYREKIDSIQAEKTETERYLAYVCNAHWDAVTRNFTYAADKAGICLNKRLSFDLAQWQGQYLACRQAYTEKLKTHRDKLLANTQALSESLSALADGGDTDSSIPENWEDDMRSLMGFMSDLARGNDCMQKTLSNLREIYYKGNSKTVSEYPEQASLLVQMIQSGQISLADILLFPEDRAAWKEIPDTVAQIREKIDHLENEAPKLVLEEIMQAVWEERHIEIIKHFMTHEPQMISDALGAEWGVLFEETVCEEKALWDKCRLQTELLEKYEQEYSRYMEESEE